MVELFRMSSLREAARLTMTKGWETSISYGALNVGTSMTKSTERFISISQNTERKGKIMKVDALENTQEEPDYTDIMLKEFPTLMNSVMTHFNVCFKLMARKQRMYGLGNISMNGNTRLAKLGIGIRLNDKVQRLLNMLDKDLDDNMESIMDTAQDITNYGAILNAVCKDEWRK
jgi:hypothetical protein